jgi:uncharacterized 2Fe-2S/4Fe-4S cluster protein (DUF4445 family)
VRKVKRIDQAMDAVKQDRHKVAFLPWGVSGAVDEGSTVAEAARQLGVEIESLCGGQATCGKCLVRIEEGHFDRFQMTSAMQHLSIMEEREAKLTKRLPEPTGYRLACAAQIHGDVVVFVPEMSRKHDQIISKEPTARHIEVDPAVRSYYVELPPASLEDARGDWERLREALEGEQGLNGLTIDYQVLLSLQDTLRLGEWKATALVWMGQEVIAVEAGRMEQIYGLAVDVGTTTVAAYLCDLSSGDVVVSGSTMNPQVAFGEDVMSRITYAMTREDGLPLMNQVIIEGINDLATRVSRERGIDPRNIVDSTIVGNTAMHHIFLNIDPRHLGRVPFAPAVHSSLDVKARDLGLRIHPGAYVHVPPIEAGFVGADNVAVLIAEEPYNSEEVALIIDIGTNGELILGNQERLLSASCATGPAFEGAHIGFGMRAAPGAIERVKIDPKTREPRYKVIGREEWSDESKDLMARGICGSGIIDVVAQMYVAGIILRSGRLNSELDHVRVRQGEEAWEYVLAWPDETAIGQDITITQKDIRAVQLAKGAMYAGARLLMRRLGVERLDKVVLAGAFGTHIDRVQAMILGLFPDCDPKAVFSVGNAAGDGARMALLGVAKRKEAAEYARRVEYVELTLEEDFTEEFAKAMYFPHMKDEFPHLRDLLPGGES